MSGFFLMEIMRFFHGGVEPLAPSKSRKNHCIGSSSRVFLV